MSYSFQISRKGQELLNQRQRIQSKELVSIDEYKWMQYEAQRKDREEENRKRVVANAYR